MLKPEDFDKKILEASSESIQKMLRNADLDSLSIALINAPKEVLDRILDEQKCHKRARELLIEDMEYRKEDPEWQNATEIVNKYKLEILEQL